MASNINPEIERLFNRACFLRNHEKGSEQAIALLEQIIEIDPDFPGAYGLLGDIYWRQEELKAANLCFRTVKKLIPKSTLASLGVFHTCWGMGEYEAALEEIKRFEKTGKKCQDYADIVAELKEKKLIDSKMNLLGELKDVDLMNKFRHGKINWPK